MIVGTNLSVKAPQGVLRALLGVVLVASGTTLILKEGSWGVVIPAVAVASLMMGVLFAAQVIQNRRALAKRRPAPA